MGEREEMAFFSSFQRPTIGVTFIFHNKVSWVKIIKHCSRSSLLENVTLVSRFKKNQQSEGSKPKSSLNRTQAVTKFE